MPLYVFSFYTILDVVAMSTFMFFTFSLYIP